MKALTPYEYIVYVKNEQGEFKIPMKSGIDSHEELAQIFYASKSWDGFEIFNIETIDYPRNMNLKRPTETTKFERKYYVLS